MTDKLRWGQMDPRLSCSSILSYNLGGENNISFSSTWRENDCHFGNTYFPKWEKRAMWHHHRCGRYLCETQALNVFFYCQQSSVGENATFMFSLTVHLVCFRKEIKAAQIQKLLQVASLLPPVNVPSNCSFVSERRESGAAALEACCCSPRAAETSAVPSTRL